MLPGLTMPQAHVLAPPQVCFTAPTFAAFNVPHLAGLHASRKLPPVLPVATFRRCGCTPGPAQRPWPMGV